MSELQLQLPTCDTTESPLSVVLEHGFGVALLDEEWIETVGDLQRHIIEKLSVTGSNSRCAKRVVFYRLRSALTKATGCKRSDIHPYTSLRALLPKHRRRALWCSIQHQLGTELPHLRFSHAIHRVTGTILIIGLLLTLIAATMLSNFVFDAMSQYYFAPVSR